ncbi:TPA: hypothetical protein SIG45_002914 [Escherichia coli]|uniref:hypothetical protein n=1 Tax=Escherichia coli TaxID=562 RepID=UPI001CDB0594|nr:hypothetical protein [Escherichia coli]MDT5375296.1 hypothetical protein [Escherichia coli]HEI0879607.1 hypothetical protein [Escherichia coli]HEI0884328.1 hypothetical protein [Escherichia coli]HEI0889267.1 hypothetical protein [Escherichia coli]HEI0893975.1 hypothetical protein [Escherichia coli]
MKQMSLIEMDGFLKGKCIPRDLMVNETNAEYLVRKFAEAEAKCAALAAEKETFAVECAAAKIVIAYLKSGRQGFSLNTPATDAFLDEVRAQGVDMARNAMIDFVDGEVGPNKNVPGLIRGAEICVSIAKQLRKGGNQ